MEVDERKSTVGMTSLQNLPDNIVSHIISYLPQQDKVNLLYCNYHFYVLVLPKLYEKLFFTHASALACPNSFDESLYTVVGTLKTPLATDKLNTKIHRARQEILLNSMSVNTELCSYVKNVVVQGYSANGEAVQPFSEVIALELVNFINQNCTNIKRMSFYQTTIPDATVSTLDYVQLSSFENLKKVTKMHVKHLEVLSAGDSASMGQLPVEEMLHFLSKLDSLVFNDERSQSIFIRWINASYAAAQPLLKLKTLKLIFYHSFDDPSKDVFSFLGKVKIEAVENLELVMGCNDLTCPCLLEFTKFLLQQNLNLKKISFVQKTGHRDHNYTEKFDFHITEMLKNYPGKGTLKYLSVRHMPPSDFNVEHGFEGNYLHRKELFVNLFPSLTGLEVLVCPTFVQSIACYEQMMSNLLWNGCRCNHCDDYLPIYDKYVMGHRYYDDMKSQMTDVVSPILFGNASNILASRMSGICDLFDDSFPYMQRYWDFHTADYQISHFAPCSIDRSAFPPICTCIAHFLQEYVDAMATMMPKLRRCSLTGMIFDRVDKAWKCSES